MDDEVYVVCKVYKTEKTLWLIVKEEIGSKNIFSIEVDLNQIPKRIDQNYELIKYSK